jgi:CelD/BcsL family acetyltransferase involved in cellulose biosynthesis
MLAPSDTVLSTEWRPLASLDGIVAEWQDLAGRAAEPNVFYEPAFARAAAPVFGADVGAVLVWSAGYRLSGLFPVRIERSRYGLPFPLLVGWTHPFAPLGTPLIDRDAIAPVLGAFLDHLAGSTLPPHLLLPCLTEDGPVAAAFDQAIAARDGRQVAFASHRRALLRPDRSDGGAISHKKRKEFARQRRRLAELGPLGFTIAASPMEVAEALPEFFALEANGWKGAKGTAAAQSPAVRQFMDEAVNGLAGQGKAEIACLRLADRMVACGLTLRSGDGAWFWKTAYDEGLARLSPGVLMTLDLTAALKGERAPAFVDSCAAPDHPMIDHLWRERRPLSDRLITVRPGPAFALACRLEAMRRTAITAAKRVRALLRR